MCDPACVVLAECFCAYIEYVWLNHFVFQLIETAVYFAPLVSVFGKMIDLSARQTLHMLARVSSVCACLPSATHSCDRLSHSADCSKLAQA